MNSTALTCDPGPNGEEDQKESTREMADQRQMREADSKKDRGKPEHQVWPHGPWESETRGEEVKRERSP